MALADVMDEVGKDLIERDEEVRLMLIGAISRQNVLFVGPPGTAKSLMVERLIKTMGVKGFVQLMHKHLPPEELIGPVRLSGLKMDEYSRVLTEMLPEAEVAFLDEIWKSAPAILNTLLRILNEREFRNGTAGMVSCPLEFCVAASNEWPIGEGFETTEALFDRFLIRKTIKAISPGKRGDLLFSPIRKLKDIGKTSDMTELKSWQATATGLTWQPIATETIEKMIDRLEQKHQIVVGDRRIRAAVSVAQANAFLSGHAEVQPMDLSVLKYVLWSRPDQETDCAELVTKMSSPGGWRIQELLKEVDETATSITDFSSTDAFTGIKKIKSLMEEMDKIQPDGHNDVMLDNAKKYIKDLVMEMNKKLAA